MGYLEMFLLVVVADVVADLITDLARSAIARRRAER